MSLQAQKLMIFRGAEAPSLEESGMSRSWTFVEQGRPEDLWPAEFAAKMQAVASATVPFRHEGEQGFSLVVVEFAPGYILARHSHTTDCLYYVVAGSVQMGKRELGPGDGFFVPADHPYAYSAGPEGVKLLEFRHDTSFHTTFHEKDHARYRAEWEAALLAARG